MALYRADMWDPCDGDGHSGAARVVGQSAHGVESVYCFALCPAALHDSELHDSETHEAKHVWTCWLL